MHLIKPTCTVDESQCQFENPFVDYNRKVFVTIQLNLNKNVAGEAGYLTL